MTMDITVGASKDAAKSLVSKLGSLLVNEYMLISGVRIKHRKFAPKGLVCITVECTWDACVSSLLLHTHLHRHPTVHAHGAYALRDKNNIHASAKYPIHK